MVTIIVPFRDSAPWIGRCANSLTSLEGNIEVIFTDVKVHRTDYVPTDADFISTSNRAFQYGKVGAYLRQTFDKRSRYESGEI